MPSTHTRLGTVRGGLRLIAAITLALATSVAHASAQRTFVSPDGDDFNIAFNCSLAAICRTFLAAIGVTNPDGEIIVLDSAGYGPVTITKSVSIISPPGIYAGISVFSPDNGIVINAAGIKVTLKGLTINGQAGNVGVGIRFTQGNRLDIDGCTVSNMGAEGILVESPGTITIADTTVIGNALGGINVNAAAVVTVVDSIVESNTGTGIAVRNGASATIDHTTVTRNTVRGISVHGVAAGTRVAVSSSVVSDNTGPGLYAEALGATLVTRLDVAGTTIARNTNGVQLNTSGGGAVKAGVVSNQIVENTASGILASGSASSVVRASWNGIFRNATGFSTSGGGVIFSPVTNYVRDNGVDGAASADALL